MVARHGIYNLHRTTLSAAISSTTATSFTVADSGDLEAHDGAVHFYARVGKISTQALILANEIVLVKRIVGTTWYVERGQCGTTATTHDSGDEVAVLLTKEALDGVVNVLAHANGQPVAATRDLVFPDAAVARDGTRARITRTRSAAERAYLAGTYR